MGKSRPRQWSVIGGVIIVALIGTLAVQRIIAVDAASLGASSFVPVVPCRLLDTRPGGSIGDRSGPLGPSETVTISVTGSHGACTIPGGATGVSANVTTVEGNATSYLTIWPSDASQPNASTNNWLAGQGPTPNKVDVKLSATGQVNVFNAGGNVNVIVDIVGYYEPADPSSSKGAATVAYISSGTSSGAFIVTMGVLQSCSSTLFDTWVFAIGCGAVPLNPGSAFRFRPSDFPATATISDTFTVRTSFSTTTCLRLFDTTSGAPVIGSEGCTTSGARPVALPWPALVQTTVTLPSVPLPAGPATYEVQVKLSGGELTPGGFLAEALAAADPLMVDW